MYAGTENLKPEYAFSGKLAAGVKDRFEGDRLESERQSAIALSRTQGAGMT